MSQVVYEVFRDSDEITIAIFSTKPKADQFAAELSDRDPTTGYTVGVFVVDSETAEQWLRANNVKR